MNQFSQTTLPDMRLVSKSFYDGAKLSWGCALFLKVVGAGLGVAFVLAGKSSLLTASSVVCAALVSELCQWRSDTLKGRAESLKRKIEYADGFGWSLSGKDISDFLATLSARSRRRIEAAVKDNYFASQQQPGCRRAIENLQESSWWSKHLSNTMGWLCAIVTAGLFFLALAALIVSVGTATSVEALQSVSRVIVSIIALVTTVGLLKLIVGYSNFSRKAEQAEQAATNLLVGDPTEVDALKVLSEYQVARISAPPVPDFIWRLRRGALNELWAQYRRSAADAAE